MATTDPEPLYVLVSSHRQRIGDEFTQFLDKLAEASSLAEPFSDDAMLVPAVQRIAETRAKLHSVYGRRPLLVQLELLRRLNYETERICTSYLEALAASSPIEAQRHSEMAQSEIDQMTDELAVFDNIRAAAEALEGEGDLGGTLGRLFAALQQLHPDLRVTELDALGRASFSEITGVEAALGTGMATLGAELTAAVHFDPQRLRMVLALVARLAHDNKQAFAAVVSDERVRRDVRRAMTLALEAYAQLALLIPSAPGDEAAFRQIIKLYKNLFEDVMAPLVAVMLRTTGTATKPYRKLMTEDAADIARRALASDVMSSMLAGVEPGYRNAESHGAYSYHLDGGEAVFELRTFNTRVAVDVVVDDCFALAESLLAMQVAINNEISLLGYDDHQPEDLGYFQPSKQQLVELLLRDRHTDNVGVDLLSEVWTVRLREQPAPLFAVAGGLDTQAPAAVQRFVVENEVGGVRHVLEIDRSAIQEMLSIDEGEPTWRSIVALAGCHLDGHPLLTDSTLRCAVAAVGLEALMANRLDRIQRLRRMRALAAESRDGQAADLAVAAIRGLRDDRALEVARRPEWQAWLERDGLTLP